MGPTGRWLTCAFLLLSWSAAAQLKERPKAGVAPMELPVTAPAGEAARVANTYPIYLALRQMMPNGRAFAVDDVTLTRDVGTITLKHGAVYLYGPVNGRSMGAVFRGEGTLHIVPPTDAERRQLRIVMKTEVVDQPFQSAVFLFTDSTAKELEAHAGAAVPGSGDAMSDAADLPKLFDKDLGVDIALHMLEGAIAAPKSPGFFAAMVKGGMFSKRMVYLVDPEGAPLIAPDQVVLLTAGERSVGGYDITLGFPMQGQTMRGAEEAFTVPVQNLDTAIAGNGELAGSTATTRVVAAREGLQVLRMNLHPTLRVSGVWDEKGRALDFIQGPKDRGEEFGIVLKEPLRSGEHMDITTKYAGKEVVLDEGNGNYYPVARTSWFPNTGTGFGNFARYRMSFHVPKNIEVVATGEEKSASVEGKVSTTVWEARTPVPAAGFSMGRFKRANSPEGKNIPLRVTAYANSEMSSDREASSNGVLGGLSTEGLVRNSLSEGVAAVQAFTLYFGPLSFEHVSLTQQEPCDYGQSWPTLVYLPSCYFFDSTVKHQIGLLNGRDHEYWNTVVAHEVSHQWWGNTVGFRSYRDQWMSEGFADFSAGIFLLETNKSMDEYREYWKSLEQQLTEKNAAGVRPVDVGPVTMGMRVSTSRAGGVYSDLIYPKGAYILHMLEMMYWTPQYREAPFQKAMQAFVNTYRGKSASTEDFKHTMEAYLPSWVNPDGSKNLDWFFNEYVYGTAIPKYSLQGDTAVNADGTTTLHFKLTQSGVDDTFVMMVPIYLRLANKSVIRAGTMNMRGNKTTEASANLGKLPAKVEKVLLNYNYDVLCAE